jgi:D-ribose pyranase
MKKTGVLNAPLARVIAAMGHTDTIVIADAGLPVPPGVPCIDLAVSPGIPAMLDVVRAVAGELQVERMLLADELLARQSDLPDALRALFPDASVDSAPHEAFKRATANARAIVRTGECTQYANVLLTSGVTF